MAKITEEQIVRSALWAAFGDAVGFPTELISANEFSKRNNIKAISGPIDWTRRVGGLFGPEVSFPVGTYSDDTQLRLSTSRAIRGDGYFDVENFAKVELTVWLNYALGAGRGSKLAASNLCLRETRWSQNFYSNSGNSYWNGGGNGAAMRVQPHVWHGFNSPKDAIVRDVVRNSICTHGHPRAIIGAAIHSLILHQTLENGEIVNPAKWRDIGDSAAILAYEAIVDDPELSLVWVPIWEDLSSKSLQETWGDTLLEWHSCVDLANDKLSDSKDQLSTYHSILTELGGFTKEERGSGLKTVLYSAAIAWLYRGSPPETGLLAAANVFSSDTDTIATMAGALIGAVAEFSPKYEIQDADYIIEEARRLFRIGNGNREQSFKYPDLLTWVPPRNQSDSWRITADSSELLGLGELQLLGSPFFSKKGTELMWQWCMLPFGQTVLAKRRNNLVIGEQGKGVAGPPLSKEVQTSQKPLFSVVNRIENESHALKAMNLDEHTQLCIKSGFNAETIGSSLLSLSQGADGIEKAIAFAAIIAKAKIARSQRE